MIISGLGTAVPAQRYTQRECWGTLQQSSQFEKLAPRSRAILRKVLTGQSGISTRRLALDPLEEGLRVDPDTLHERFRRHAPTLAAAAAQRAMADAEIQVRDVDALVISTCTGYLCPGLTSYVAELLGTRAEVAHFDLVGQGCAAAIPNLRLAEALLAAGRASHVLSICVEVCSAAMYLDDDPGVLISACLFGDGAGAAVLSAVGKGRRNILWRDSESLLIPAARDQLRFDLKGGLLRNVLSQEVPQLAGQAAKSVLNACLQRQEIRPDEIRGWVLHPGGRDVLAALQEQLELDAEQLRWSATVLREYGNLSSASLFFVLEHGLNEGMQPGPLWMSSFGAGFACHGALLDVAPP